MKHQDNMPAAGAWYCALRLAPAIAAGLGGNRFTYEERTAEVVGSPAYFMDSREDGGC